jgi:hypothetical protein
MIEKIPHTIVNYNFPLKCGFCYGSGRKYQPISVSVRNQNSGFGHTLLGWTSK